MEGPRVQRMKAKPGWSGMLSPSWGSGLLPQQIVQCPASGQSLCWAVSPNYMDFKLLGALHSPSPSSFFFLLLPLPAVEKCSGSFLNCVSLELDVIDVNGAGSPVGLQSCVFITGEKEAVLPRS